MATSTTTTLAPNQVDGIQRSGVGAADEFDLLEGTRLETWDIIVIVAYFVIVLGFGLWVSLLNFSFLSHIANSFIVLSFVIRKNGHFGGDHDGAFFSGFTTR